MVTKITCPECEAVLKPAKPVLAGKTIKCPKCGAGFVVPSEDEEPAPAAKPKAAAAPAKKGAAKSPAKKSSDKVAKKPVKEEKAAPAPAKKKDAFDDDDGGGLTYGVTKEPEEEEDDEEKKKVKINYAPDTSIKDLRGPAQAAVIQPTNMLTVTGVLGFIGWLALLVIILIPILFPLGVESTNKDSPTPVLDIQRGFGMQANFPAGSGKAEVAEKEEPSLFIVLGFDLAIFALYPWHLLILVLLPLFLGMLYSGLIIIGAVKTQNLESRRWGIAACIMAMLPFNAAGLIVDILLGFSVLLHMLLDDQELISYISIAIAGLFCLGEIGVAIWCLVVLMKEDVIAGFEFIAD